MECVRHIVDSEMLSWLHLPQTMRNQKVEIIIIPAEKKENEKNIKEGNAFGILHKHANPELIPREKEAWGMAVIEKHADR
ncbi:MAG: hypothetical protein LBS21_05900 [Clostridiales bacterium]|nr:hypothetical protein [Clostridiales bacterium]